MGNPRKPMLDLTDRAKECNEIPLQICFIDTYVTKL
jgi:hypothetical protein